MFLIFQTSNCVSCMQNIWWLILWENSLVCKSNVVQVPFWEMLYKGKPQNLQYSRVVVASLDAYPTFFPFVSFHLNEIKSQKNILWGFFAQYAKEKPHNKILTKRYKNFIPDGDTTPIFRKKVIWIFAPKCFTNIMTFSKNRK